MNARGFGTEDEARQFGQTLKTALEVSAVAARVGVDTGRNLATSALGKTVKDAIAQEGVCVRDNIHGLDVFPDHANTRIFAVNATGIIHAAPDPFLSDLDGIVRAAVTLSQRIADIILLLNYALMRPEPVAQIVFAVSAVESLGTVGAWIGYGVSANSWRRPTARSRRSPRCSSSQGMCRTSPASCAALRVWPAADTSST